MVVSPGFNVTGVTKQSDDMDFDVSVIISRFGCTSTELRIREPASLGIFCVLVGCSSEQTICCTMLVLRGEAIKVGVTKQSDGMDFDVSVIISRFGCTSMELRIWKSA